MLRPPAEHLRSREANPTFMNDAGLGNRVTQSLTKRVTPDKVMKKGGKTRQVLCRVGKNLRRTWKARAGC